MTQPIDFRTFDDPSALAEAACELIALRARAAVAERGLFTIALSGGSTPRALYARLAARTDVPFEQLELFFGDERPVPPEDAQSNARLVRETLLSNGRIPPERVHRIEGELPPLEAASRYEQQLRARFPEAVVPRFDLVLLGLGADGHTASLFPHSSALSERTAWTAAHWVASQGSYRLTLTYPVLNAAREALFLIAGADKRPALTALRERSASVAEIPALGIVLERGETHVWSDRAAWPGDGAA